MQIPTDAVLLRIFIGESDRWQHKPLYEAIVLAAREAQLAGATVLIEIVDAEEKINSFLPTLDKMMGGGLVTLEKARVLHYRSGE